jgi:RNA polymerase sigma-70 factor (ECF subfamily)
LHWSLQKAGEAWLEPFATLSKELDNPTLDLVDKIQRVIDREENSRRLFELHRPRVLAYFKRKGFPPEECRDLTQEVFLRVFKAIDTFRRESSFEWWMLGIADSVYKNELRRRGAEKRDGVEHSLDALVSEDSHTGPRLSLAATGPTPEQEVDRKEQIARIRAALHDLPLQMRLCCTLRYERGLKYQEIATVMKISIETVKAHLHQARKRLIATLGDGTDRGAT